MYLEEKFGYNYNFLGVVVAVEAVFPLMFMFLFTYGIKKLNFLRR
jgi:hypothetical protein